MHTNMVGSSNGQETERGGARKEFIGRTVGYEYDASQNPSGPNSLRKFDEAHVYWHVEGQHLTRLISTMHRVVLFGSTEMGLVWVYDYYV